MRGPADLPPGPGAGRLVQGVAFHRDPLGVTQRARARFGDVFTLRMAGTSTVVVVADPAAAAELALADPARAHTGEGRHRILTPISHRAILASDGAEHRAARSRVAACFEAEAIDRHRLALAALAAEHVARWPRGRPFRLLPRMRAIADDAFVRCLLGVRDEARAQALAAAIGRMLWTPGNPPVSPPGEGNGLMGALVLPAFRRRRAPVEALLREELAERRRSPDQDGGDVLAALLRAEPDRSDDELLEELLPLLMAGQEPPAAALTWLLDRLARHPGAADRFAAGEIDDAFVRETLRVRPAVAALMRRLTEPADVAGHRIPAGRVVLLPIPLLHRDPRTFPEPAAFRPARWAALGEPGAYVPFGGGARRCLGEALAHAQIEVVVPEILRRVRLRALWPRPERMVVRATVLVPHRGGLAVATDRAL